MKKTAVYRYVYIAADCNRATGNTLLKAGKETAKNKTAAAKAQSLGDSCFLCIPERISLQK